MSKPKRAIYPLSVDPELDAMVEEAAKKLAMPKSEVMRLAMRIGIAGLRRVNYDVAKIIAEKAWIKPE